MTESNIHAHVVATFDVANPNYRVDLHSGRHRWEGDEPESNGGGNAGPSPFALWLSGLGACTAITLRMYAERKGWDVGGINVELDYIVDDEAGSHVERRIRFGNPLDDEQRSRLAEIADKTPVTKVVMAGMRIATQLLA